MEIIISLLNPLWIIIMGAASARLAYMLVYEEGAFNIALHLRLLLGVRYGQWSRTTDNLEFKSLNRHEVFEIANLHGNLNTYKKLGLGNFGRMLTCYYCTSVVTSLLLVITTMAVEFNTVSLADLFSGFCIWMVVSSIALGLHNAF